MAIIGASGSGKSTLLHILGSVDKPAGGKVIIDGTDLSKLNQTQASIFRRRKVGLVYQFYNLDVMMTVKNTRIEDFLLTEELRGLAGVDSSVVYQKTEAVCILPQDAQSRELLALGGLEVFSGDSAFSGEGLFRIKAPIFILDDESFAEFCGQIGITFRLEGTILLNRLWDSVNSNHALEFFDKAQAFLVF